MHGRSTCRASSLVGAKIRALSLLKLPALKPSFINISRCIIGSPNARVLPEPCVIKTAAHCAPYTLMHIVTAVTHIKWYRVGTVRSSNFSMSGHTVCQANGQCMCTQHGMILVIVVVAEPMYS